MLHHVSVGTNDVKRARKFYDAVLAVVGLRCLNERNGSADYGASDTIFSVEKPVDGKPATAGNGVHIAFTAGSRAMVQAFYDAALANGAWLTAELQRALLWCFCLRP